MNTQSKIYVAGHTGLVGSALIRVLQANGYQHIITRTQQELDLRDQAQVLTFFRNVQPEYVFLAAAKVGGIWANMHYPAEFIYDNLMIELNVMHAAYLQQVKKLLFLGSSCIYPRDCQQPIKEEYLLTSHLEKTNEPYAIAKIAGIKICQAYNKQYGTQFICCMPTNLYGPHDNFNLEHAHVLPALIRKIYTAHKNHESFVQIWGTGAVYREFLYVDDLADAALFLMKHYCDTDIINIGTGADVTIKSVAEQIKHTIGYTGEFIYDTSKPDGTPRKLLDVSKLKKLGWTARTPLLEGITQTIEWCRTENIF